MAAITAEEMGLARPYFPNGHKNLRACLRCRFIMEMEQFVTAGCPTCREVLEMKDDPARVRACTTTRYAGVMAMMRPGSFVTRYNGLEKRMPGFYALRAYGKIPAHIRNQREVEMMEEKEFLDDFIAPPTPTGERPAKRAREDDELSIDSGIFTPEAERESPADAIADAGADAESEREDEQPTPAAEPLSPVASPDAVQQEKEGSGSESNPDAVQQEKEGSGSESKEDIPNRPYPSGSEAEKSASGAESNRTRTSGEESKHSAQTSASSQMIVEPEADEEFRKYHGK